MYDELSVMQLSDSFFPTGLFATSNGLESLFLDKKITNVTDLIKYAKTCIKYQIGPSDCVILSNCIKLCKLKEHDKIKELDEICCAMKTIKETREASLRSGIQLARCVREFQNDNTLNWYWQEIQEGSVTGVYPVSFAICCNALQISKDKAELMFLYSFVSSMSGAALRLGMIQHFESQRVIHELKSDIIDIIKENSTKSIQDIWQFSPQIEINQMRHESMDTKMFIT